jgi:hypothetical protein
LAAQARTQLPGGGGLYGAVAPEAIQAVGLMAEDRRDVGLLAVTSADRLNAGWTAAQRARERGLVHARSHIEKLLADAAAHCGIVTVLDGHPATLAWLGAVHGHRVRPLGVEHFGQTGSIPTSIGTTASTPMPWSRRAPLTPGRPIRHLKGVAVTRDVSHDRQHHRGNERRSGDDRRVGQCFFVRHLHQQRQIRPQTGRDRKSPG